MDIDMAYGRDFLQSEIRTFSFRLFDSRMYVLIWQDKALVIDPADDVTVYPYLSVHNVKEVIVLLTHEHFDHFTGLEMLRQHFFCQVICSCFTGEAIGDVKKNLSYYHEFMVSELMASQRAGVQANQLQPITGKADFCYDHDYTLSFAGCTWQCILTPGHSKGSSCIIGRDPQGCVCCVFTGDSLMKDYPTRTNLPGGSSQSFRAITRELLLSLPENIVVYPGHGEPAVLSEIKYRLYG